MSRPPLVVRMDICRHWGSRSIPSRPRNLAVVGGGRGWQIACFSIQSAQSRASGLRPIAAISARLEDSCKPPLRIEHIDQRRVRKNPFTIPMVSFSEKTPENVARPRPTIAFVPLRFGKHAHRPKRGKRCLVTHRIPTHGARPD